MFPHPDRPLAAFVQRAPIYSVRQQATASIVFEKTTFGTAGEQADLTIWRRRPHRTSSASEPPDRGTVPVGRHHFAAGEDVP
jgi:hypothetical protein